MTYYVHLFQGGGCDYMIACGHEIRKLKAATEDEAVAEVKKILGENYYRDIVAKSILAVEKTVPFDTKSLYEEHRKAREEAKKAAETKAELELLAKLQKKHNKA